MKEKEQLIASYGIIKIACIFSSLLGIIYVCVLLNNINYEQRIASSIWIFTCIMFVVFDIYLFGLVSLGTPKKTIFRIMEDTPEIAIIVPIYSEPVALLKSVLLSIINQDYPNKQIKLFIANDGRQDEVSNLLIELALQFPDLYIREVFPPKHNTPERKLLGDAKSGALNAALNIITKEFSHIEFVETRDCDDEVGSPKFLRYLSTYLNDNKNTGFVQTYKKAVPEYGPTSTFDCNLFFLQTVNIHFKDLNNSVFTMGSGCLYRLDALMEINGFSTWNLVEDHQTSAEILQKGWDSKYLDIIGCVTYHPPNDLANFLKQRSVWWMDHIRFLKYSKEYKLTIKQKFHFFSTPFVETLSPICVILMTLLFIYRLFSPIDLISQLNNFEIFLICSYLFVTQLTYFTLYNLSLSRYLKTRVRLEMFMFPVAFYKIVFSALKNKKTHKPRYKITRKNAVYSVNINLVKDHIFVLFLLIIGIIYHVFFNIKTDQGILIIASIISIGYIDSISLAYYKTKYWEIMKNIINFKKPTKEIDK